MVAALLLARFGVVALVSAAACFISKSAESAAICIEVSGFSGGYFRYRCLLRRLILMAAASSFDVGSNRREK